MSMFEEISVCYPFEKCTGKKKRPIKLAVEYISNIFNPTERLQKQFKDYTREQIEKLSEVHYKIESILKILSDLQIRQGDLR